MGPEPGITGQGAAAPMSPEVWRIVSDVFALVSELPPDEREARLAQEPAEVQREVRSLLSSFEADTDYLEKPVVKRTTRSFPVDRYKAGARLGPYRLLRELGRGGMGTVFLAVREDEINLGVAIKLIRRGLDTEALIRRFRQERQILATLDHPGIARLLDGGTTEDGWPYLVMECVEGRRIDDYCRGQELSVNARVQLFCKVCDAVQHAHQRLVVHRDIKPGNILVTESGEPKLLDFGIAKLVIPDTEGPQTTLMTVAPVFTPEYASPEQVRGETVGVASDVYSLGVLLYELLTGSLPYKFESRSLADLARAVQEQEPPRPSTAAARQHTGGGAGERPAKRQRLQGDLDNIILKALRKDPRERYGSVEQLADDLRRYLDGLPVKARPLTMRYRTLKFLQRNKAYVASASIAASLILLGAGTAIWEAHKAQQSQIRAEQSYTEVRELANSVLFEINDELDNFRGPTHVRELLLRRGLQYLDKLAQQAGDVSVKRELAQAYHRLGSVQGLPAAANQGRRRDAEGSLRKALRMQEAVVQAAPGNRADQRMLARILNDLHIVLRSLGRFRDAEVLADRAQSVAETLLQKSPLDQETRLTIAILQLSRVYSGPGHTLDQDLARARGALMMFDQLATEGLQNRDMNQYYPEALRTMSDFHVLRKEYDLARALNRRADELQQTLLAKSPQNPSLRYELTRTWNGEAFTAWQQHRLFEALAGYLKVRSERETLYQADPANAEIRTELAATYTDLGWLYRDLQQYSESVQAHQQAVLHRQAMLEADPANQQMRFRLADSWRALGRAHLDLAAKADKDAAAEHRELACKHLRMALPVYEERTLSGALDPLQLNEEQRIEVEIHQACEAPTGEGRDGLGSRQDAKVRGVRKDY